MKHPAATYFAEMATKKVKSCGATCFAGVAMATQVESLRNPAKLVPKPQGKEKFQSERPVFSEDPFSATTRFTTNSIIPPLLK